MQAKISRLLIHKNSPPTHNSSQTPKKPGFNAIISSYRLEISISNGTSMDPPSLFETASDGQAGKVCYGK